MRDGWRKTTNEWKFYIEYDVNTNPRTVWHRKRPSHVKYELWAWRVSTTLFSSEANIDGKAHTTLHGDYGNTTPRGYEHNGYGNYKSTTPEAGANLPEQQVLIISVKEEVANMQCLNSQPTKHRRGINSENNYSWTQTDVTIINWMFGIWKLERQFWLLTSGQCIVGRNQRSDGSEDSKWDREGFDDSKRDCHKWCLFLKT